MLGNPTSERLPAEILANPGGGGFRGRQDREDSKVPLEHDRISGNLGGREGKYSNISNGKGKYFNPAR